MEKQKSATVGIDISKMYFDIYFKDFTGKEVVTHLKNNKEGFADLLKKIPLDSWVVMEASGPYYYSLASFLYEKGIKVAVINPLVIRRFMQMQLKRTKTDSADAKGIALYGQLMQLKKWKPLKENYLKIKQWWALRKQLLKSHHALNRQLEAFLATGDIDGCLKKTIEKEIIGLNEKIKKVDNQLNDLIKTENGALKEQLESIPGIGSKTSLILIISLRGLEDFNNYKEVISYLGLSPRIYESGTSVKGKSKICKMGMSEARKCLYMAALSSKRHNAACRELYSRLRARGKAHRVAMIAVVNKLIKQAFAIAKNGTLYEDDFQSQLVKSK